MTSTNNNFSDTWLNSQKQMWDSWMEFTEEQLDKNAGQDNNEFNPMDFTKQWQTLFQQQDMPPTSMDFYNRVISASNEYLNMANSFSNVSKDGLDMQTAVTNWVEYMQSFAEQNNGCSNKNFWDLPHDTLQRTMGSLSPFPGDFFRAFRQEGVSRMPGDIHGNLDQFLSTPALGYTRESQEMHKNMSRLLLDYQKSSNAYNSAMNKVHMDALELFQTRIQKEENVESLKDIYNLWVASCEDVYAEHATSETYTKLYGEMVNSLMGVKKQTSVLVDEFLETMNMPTRKEINTLHKRLQETRRAYNTMQNDDIDEMKADIEELKATIAKLTAKKGK